MKYYVAFKDNSMEHGLIVAFDNEWDQADYALWLENTSLQQSEYEIALHQDGWEYEGQDICLVTQYNYCEIHGEYSTTFWHEWRTIPGEAHHSFHQPD